MNAHCPAREVFEAVGMYGIKGRSRYGFGDGDTGYRQQKISEGIEGSPSKVRIPERKDLGGIA